MFRTTLTRALTGTNGRLVTILNVRAAGSVATPAKAPEKIEVFVDDQSVWVEPGTTVLQVCLQSNRLIQSIDNYHIEFNGFSFDIWD